MRKLRTQLTIDDDTFAALMGVYLDDKFIGACNLELAYLVAAKHGMNAAKETLRHYIRTQVPDITDEELAQLES